MSSVTIDAVLTPMGSLLPVATCSMVAGDTFSVRLTGNGGVTKWVLDCDGSRLLHRGWPLLVSGTRVALPSPRFGEVWQLLSGATFIVVGRGMGEYTRVLWPKAGLGSVPDVELPLWRRLE